MRSGRVLGFLVVSHADEPGETETNSFGRIHFTNTRSMHGRNRKISAFDFPDLNILEPNIRLNVGIIRNVVI